MATMKPTLRRIELRSIITVLAGLLCGVGIMTGVSLVHPLKQQAAEPIFVVGAPSVSPGVVGGRLGGINSSDTANDAAIRSELNGFAGFGALPKAASANFILPGDVDGGTFNAPVAETGLTAVNGLGHVGSWAVSANAVSPPTAPIIGGRLGGAGSADTANDAAIKSDGSTSIQNVQSGGSAATYGDVAGQRDVNAAIQSGETESYPTFWSGRR